MDDEYEIRDRYIQSFVQHLKDTGARMGLRPQVNEDGINVRDAVPKVHALSTWTPAEYDAFFRAVSVHSRWRPDLIAACVPTRSQWEVWMYLEALEEGAAGLADEDVDMQDDGSSSSSGSGMDEDEYVCKPAFEVSQGWIDMEERIASWIVDEERRASLENGAVADTEEVEDEPVKKKRGRPRGAGKGRSRSRVRGQTVSPPPDRRSLSPESTSVSVIRKSLMARLEVPHLLVLDNMLREGEEATNTSDKKRKDSVPGTPTEDEVVTTGVPRPPSDAMIDPVLLAMSGDADTVTDQPDARGASPQFQPMFPLDNGNANVGSDPTLFSPRSRRRHQKRLYMRQRRASEKGSGTVDTRMERLKPGKKVKSEQRAPAPRSEASFDSEAESTENASKTCRGLTLPYKLKAQFAEMGVDAAYLRSQGTDLLNMSTLGRLMGLYASLEQGEEEAAAESIDAELIRLLQAAVVLFVTEVIHRAIVWKERDVRLKQRCQAWRHGEQITINAIERAVEATGARHASHKEYFGTLEAQHGFSTGSGKAPDVDPDVGRPWSYGEGYTPYTEWSGGSPLSDTTDSEGLAAELEDEAAADGRDVAQSRAHESDLWGG